MSDADRLAAVREAARLRTRDDQARHQAESKIADMYARL